MLVTIHLQTKLSNTFSLFFVRVLTLSRESFYTVKMLDITFAFIMDISRRENTCDIDDKVYRETASYDEKTYQRAFLVTSDIHSRFICSLSSRLLSHFILFISFLPPRTGLRDRESTRKFRIFTVESVISSASSSQYLRPEFTHMLETCAKYVQIYDSLYPFLNLFNQNLDHRF